MRFGVNKPYRSYGTGAQGVRQAPKWIKQHAAAVAIIGNSITDGRGSDTNKQNRWPDVLSERLLENPGTQNVGVLNLGIGDWLDTMGAVG